MIALLAAAVIAIANVTSHPGVDTAVVYATIHNNGTQADVLDGVSSPLGSASLHESTGGMHDGMSTMSMQAVAAITIAAHGDLRLAPGGYHVMLENLRTPLRSGEHIPLRFHFRRSGWVSAGGKVTSY